MLDVRYQSYPDLRGILDFYKSELESDNKAYIFEALRRYSIVSKVVGRDNSEFFLLPLISNVVEFDNYEINHIVSEELINIIDVNINYSSESKCIIRKIFSKLLFSEEISIRMESIKSIEVIFSKFISNEFITSFIEEIILPIIKEKCSYSEKIVNSSLTDKLSFCNIIPTLILPYCNKIEKNNFVLLYLSLCDDEVPSLRIGASQNLVQILKKIYPLKFGMTVIEYNEIKLIDQNIITEKLLNLVLSLSNDQTSCEILKSASVGIAIHLYTNPVFYLEYISPNDRTKLLYFVCDFLDNKYHSQRRAIIGELLPICLSVKGYYELSEIDKNIAFKSYLTSSNESILSNITINNKTNDLIECIFDILSNEGETDIKILVLNFFITLIILGIDTHEESKDSSTETDTEIKKKTPIVNLLNSIILYVYKNLSEFQLEVQVLFKNSLCTMLVHLIKYIGYLSSETSLFGICIENIKVKFIQAFVSYFKDSNTNVIINAIEHLHVIINQINKEYIFCYIFPQIKTLIFTETEIISYNGKQTERAIAVQNWRIKRCIIRQLPCWSKSFVFNGKICSFLNCIIIRCIIDPTFTVNVSALQSIMEIISGFETFEECIHWTNEFVIPSVFIPYIEGKSHSINISYEICNSQTSSEFEVSEEENKETFDYSIDCNNYNVRILILNVIFAIFRSLFYKWVFINFENLKESLLNEEKVDQVFIKKENEGQCGTIILTETLEGEEIFVKLSKLVVPIIYSCITDPIVNVSISASNIVLQIIKLFSIGSDLPSLRKFETSDFCERSNSINNCEDELLKRHLINQFEFDSIWHLRSIMSDNKIEFQSLTYFPSFIYREFGIIFKKYCEIEVSEAEEELNSVVNSVRMWYNSVRYNLE